MMKKKTHKKSSLQEAAGRASFILGSNSSHFANDC